MLDAMIGCYLNLRGADGLALIEDQFLKNDKSEYVDTYSAIVAPRVSGQETDVIQGKSSRARCWTCSIVRNWPTW